MNCYLCKAAGHGDQPAHRDLGNGKGVCRFHFEGSMMPTATPGVVIPAQAGIQEVAPAIHIPAKETAMERKGTIDFEKVRELHAKGLSDGEIGEQLGCSTGGVLYARKRLGLPAIGKRGPRKSKGNGTVGDAMARLRDRADRRGLGVSRGGSFLSAEAAADLTSLLEINWRGFTLQEKVCAVDRVFARRAETRGK